LSTPRAHAEGIRVGLIVLVTIAAYANGLPGAFQFDDWNVIVHNPAVHSFSAWWETMPGIRALLKATYVANWASGAGLVGFHVVNVAVHAVNALLVYGLLLRLLPSLDVRSGAVASAAFWIAILFALHPAQTEAVTYISGRSGSLMAAFYFAAILAHLQSRRVLSSFLFVCSLLCKENAWTLPAALLLVEAVKPDFRWAPAFRRIAPQLAVLVVLAAAVLLIPAYWRLLGASLETRSLGDNLLSQIDGQWYLITRPLLGLVLNIDPDVPVRTEWALDLVRKGAVLLALVGVGVGQWRRRPWLGFGLLWFFVHLLATNSFLPRTDVANDRALYLALLGPATIVVVALHRMLSKGPALAAVAVLAIVLGAHTVMRNSDYRTEIALWEVTAIASPHKSRVWNNLGFVLHQAGEIIRARYAYEVAIDLDPENYRAQVNLGSLEAEEREKARVSEEATDGS
jgi:tetratricopeptide (TPR) repeat protein